LLNSDDEEEHTDPKTLHWPLFIHSWMRWLKVEHPATRAGMVYIWLVTLTTIWYWLEEWMFC